MVIAVRELAEIEVTFFLEHGRRVIAPVGFHHDGVVWFGSPQELIDRIGLSSRVP
jgi:hypothetical protein